ncbi:class I SAM-dependent methyltransferase [Mycobacterium sp. SM3041]|uniref:class I SAM-dependent methyltransferase n=1 Tax=Mycobacterium sp. SM3041 TaxID=3114291 RepID=UPI003204F2CD
MSEVMDWDAAYRHEIFMGPPPWNIGAPQPEILALIDAGKVTGPVLDAGCGVGDVALALAERGYEVTGIDLSTVAIEQAAAAAADRGLTTARFLQGDLRDIGALGLTQQFNTVIDCTLFHSLPVEARDDYLRGIHEAAAAGAALYLLVFTKDALPADSPCPIPNQVTEAEVRDAVAAHWSDVATQASFVAVKLPDIPGLPPHNFPIDDAGRVHLPALLLTARKA